MAARLPEDVYGQPTASYEDSIPGAGTGWTSAHPLSSRCPRLQYLTDWHHVSGFVRNNLGHQRGDRESQEPDLLDSPASSRASSTTGPRCSVIVTETVGTSVASTTGGDDHEAGAAPGDLGEPVTRPAVTPRASPCVGMLDPVCSVEQSIR